MCGIVGTMGNLGWDVFKAFEDMLKIDVIRGDDSTGVAFIGKKKVNVVKGTLLPSELIDDAQYIKFRTPLVLRGVIGHNRFATKGDVTPDNAHPFRHGAITGVHNGTVHSLFRFPAKNGQFDTDSETIIHAIDQQGIDKTWEQLDGAAALVFWDNRAKTMNIITNGKRDLWIANSKDNKQVYWASEDWMIKAALDRRGQDDYTVWKPKEHFLFTFKWDGKKDHLTWQGRELKSFVFPIAARNNFYRKEDVKDARPFGVKNDQELEDWDLIGGYYPQQHHNQPLVKIPPNEDAANKAASGYVQEVFGESKEEESTKVASGSEPSTDKIVDLSLVPPSQSVYTKSMNRDVFYRKYGTCDICLESTNCNYETAIILDRNLVACKPCAKGMELNGLSLLDFHMLEK